MGKTKFQPESMTRQQAMEKVFTLLNQSNSSVSLAAEARTKAEVFIQVKQTFTVARQPGQATQTQRERVFKEQKQTRVKAGERELSFFSFIYIFPRLGHCACLLFPFFFVLPVCTLQMFLRSQPQGNPIRRRYHVKDLEFRNNHEVECFHHPFHMF